MLKDYFEVPNKPAIKSGNVLSCDFTDHETFIPQPLDFTRNTLATYVDCNGLIKVSGVSDTELVTNGDFSNGSTDWTIDPAWSIANGKAFYDETINSQRLKQDIVTDASKTYQIKFTISGVESGKFARFALWGLSNASSKFFTYTQFKDGDYVVYASLDGPNGNVLHFNAINGASSDSSFYITNISLKEVDVNVPRIDYLTEIGKAKELQKPSLLLEPQSTNLVTQSNNPYILEQVTKTSVLSPEGINNAFRLTETTANAQHYASILSSVTSGVVHSISFFIKKGNGYTTARIYTQSVRIDSNVTVNFETKSITLAGTDIVAGSEKLETYPNGWFRVSYSATPIATGSMYIYAVVKDLSSYIGSTDNYIDYYGFQVEQQNYTTSYIPTSGSTVTRNKDQCENAGSAPVFNSQEGTFYIEAQALHGNEVNLASTRRISVSDGTNNNRATITYTQANAANFLYKVGGTNSLSRSIGAGNAQLEKMNKFAFTWKTDEFKIWNNGVEYGPRDTTGVTNTANTFIEFGFNRETAGSSDFLGRIRNVKVYRRVLTDAELTELTNNIR